MWKSYRSAPWNMSRMVDNDIYHRGLVKNFRTWVLWLLFCNTNPIRLGIFLKKFWFPPIVLPKGVGAGTDDFHEKHAPILTRPLLHRFKIAVTAYQPFNFHIMKISTRYLLLISEIWIKEGYRFLTLIKIRLPLTDLQES